MCSLSRKDDPMGKLITDHLYHRVEALEKNPRN